MFVDPGSCGTYSLTTAGRLADRSARQALAVAVAVCEETDKGKEMKEGKIQCHWLLHGMKRKMIDKKPSSISME